MSTPTRPRGNQRILALVGIAVCVLALVVVFAFGIGSDQPARDRAHVQALGDPVAVAQLFMTDAFISDDCAAAATLAWPPPDGTWVDQCEREHDAAGLVAAYAHSPQPLLSTSPLELTSLGGPLALIKSHNIDPTTVTVVHIHAYIHPEGAVDGAKELVHQFAVVVNIDGQYYVVAPSS